MPATNSSYRSLNAAVQSLTVEPLPTFEQWKKDSSVSLAIRDKDPILRQIDHLVRSYHLLKRHKGHDRADLGIVLCDLFLSLNSWVKRSNEGSKVQEKGRRDAVLTLFGAVVRLLRKDFGVRSDHAVGEMITELFGLENTVRGRETDLDMKMVPFPDDDMRKFRVTFKSGLAYQLPWWKDTDSLQPKPAESMHGFVEIARRKEGKHGNTVSAFNVTSRGFSGFVMTMERDLYMTKHLFDAKRKTWNHFHSSYTNGGVVLMAGTILVEKGIVKGIRTDSGHYKPSAHNLRACCQGLAMHGVKLPRVKLYNYDDQFICTADTFLYGARSWEAMISNRSETQQRRADATEMMAKRNGEEIYQG